MKLLAVLDILIAAPNNQLARKGLLWRLYGTANSFTLDQVLENLVEMGWIRKEKVGIGKELDWLVHLAGEPKESYMKYVKSRGE